MSRTHDYTERSWGHDFTIQRAENGGMNLGASGWGRGIRAGDFLILPNKDSTTRYEVERITYYHDPPDMWRAGLKFSPRKDSE